MDKATLKEKQEWISEMTRYIWQSNESPQEKQRLDKQLIDIVGKNISKQELEQKRQEMLMSLNKKKQEISKEITKDLKDPKNISNVSDIKNINTLNRDNGQVITSVQKNNGSIYVSDSTYSGNIDMIVDEIIDNPNNKDMSKEELTKIAFDEMQRRQKDVNMQNVYNSDINNKEINKRYPNSDGLKVNKEYQIMIDENNKIYDMKNPNSQVNTYDSNSYQDDNKEMVQEKPKILTYKRTTSTLNDSAFVDAALVGIVTFYAGVLGLCSIFSQM